MTNSLPGLILIAAVGGALAVFIVRAFDSMPEGVLSQILGYSFPLVALIGCVFVINKYISPRVEATDKVWDGFALLFGGIVGITLVGLGAAVLGLWLGEVVTVNPK